MKKELLNTFDKELLFKDLCARLPYGVKFECNKNVYTAKGLDLIVTDEGDWEYAVTAKGIAPIEIDFIKPYLFPLSSMTDEDKFEFRKLTVDYDNKESMGNFMFKYEELLEELEMIGFFPYEIYDWLNKNHFDYRGLIEKGLALDTTNLNIY